MLGGSEDDGILAAPAVGILVRNMLFSQQHARILQFLQYGFVGGLIEQSCKGPCFLGQMALAVNRHHNTQLRIFLAHLKVLCTVSGSGMNAAGTGFQRNMVPHNNQGITVQEGMSTNHVFQLIALDFAKSLIFGKTCHCHDAFHQFLGHDIAFTVVSFHHNIIKLRIETYGQVAGQGPCGGGPDNHIQVIQGIHHPFKLTLVILNGELHIDGIAMVLLVFNFCLCQSSLTGGAPVNGAHPLVNAA